MNRLRRATPALLAAGALSLSALSLGTLPVLPASAAGSQPGGTGVSLFSPDQHPVMTIHNSGPDQWVDFSPGIYLESATSRLEIDVRRADFDKPLSAAVKIGDRSVTLPERLLDGWSGLKNAFLLTWRNSSGEVVSRRSSSWCPNDGSASRLGPDSATRTAFTWGCSTHPFTRGQRWGVDRGWARQALAYGIEPPVSRLGDHSVLTVTLRHELAQAFGIPDSARTLRFDVTTAHVVDDTGDGPTPDPVPSRPAVGSASARTAHAAPRTSTAASAIPAAALPDLISLPAFGIATHTEDGHDLLDFSATVYNGGRGPLVAEGYRRGSELVMDAYQFFYSGSHQVASTKVGTMEYDARPSHQHWHFEDFAVYDLVDKDRHRLRTSGKEAFCLAPTDAIDLLIPGAAINPGNGDLATACGDISSIWVREVLAAGWGDTYSQYRAGQSIDVTGLANGTYWIRVTANPASRLHEVSHGNNTSLRRVILGGKPGARTVRVPTYGLIDSEEQEQSVG
ncbi:MAG: lysyl oxidase family protein [Marmoricola sp.]